MGVRNYFPSSIAKRSRNGIAFVVTLCVGEKRLRVEVMLDLQERLLFVPVGILPDISTRIPIFVEKMGAIRFAAFGRIRFNVVLGEPTLLQVDELNQRSEVRLDE